MSKYIDANKMIKDTEAMKQVSDAVTLDGILKYIDENSIDGLDLLDQLFSERFLNYSKSAKYSVEQISEELKPLGNEPKEQKNTVCCKDCQYLEIEGVYGLCKKEFGRFVNPDTCCDKGVKKRGKVH